MRRFGKQLGNQFGKQLKQRLKQRLNGIISKHTGRAIEQVERDCDRDNFMSADEAKAYGLVDEVVQSRKEIPGFIEQATSLADKKE